MKMYLCDIREFLDLSGIERLDSGRRNQLFRYRLSEDRARCLTAGLMLLSVLGKESYESISVSRFGKPFLPNGPCFNLSHSGNKVVLVTDEQETGVDIEAIVPYPLNVVRKVFTEFEQSWLRFQATDEAFYRLWTGKEAVMKALGLGFQLPPESFEISPDPASANTVCGRIWYLHWQKADGHMICTASERPLQPDKPILLTKNDLIK